MRVYCAQIAQVWNDPDTAFARAHDAVLRALEDDADLVMFSEQYATGWRSAGDGCDTVSGDEVKARWLSLAREFGVAVAGSYAREVPGRASAECDAGCRLRGEVLAEYAKMHLFTPDGEDMRYSAGTAPICFSYGGVKFGCAICFDLRFPELFRAYLHAGCACVLVQAAWPAARVADWELLLRARALENRGFVAGASGMMLPVVLIIQVAGWCVIMRDAWWRMQGCLQAGALQRWMRRGALSGGRSGG